MRYTLKGTLSGSLCADCPEAIANAKLFAFLANGKEQEKATTDPKTSLDVITGQQFEDREGQVLGSTLTNQEGQYQLQLEKLKPGTTITLIIELNEVPGQKKASKTPVFVVVNTFTPFEGNTQEAEFTYVLPSKFWCMIRGLFDAWVICGTVLDCSTKRPAPAGLKVTAMDADFLQDDKLGETFTQTGGRFRIDYTSADFKKTFLSPFINLETPFSNNFGPDVYFTVQDRDGNFLIKETKQDGRQPGRKDVTPCLCIKLCLELPEIVTTGSAWNRIGDVFDLPDSAGLNDITPNGMGQINGTGIEYALAGNLTLKGTLGLSSSGIPLNGNPIQYRFRVWDNSTLTNDQPNAPESNFTKVIGREIALQPFKVGNVYFKLGNQQSGRSYEIFAKQEDLLPDGWVDVNQIIRREMQDQTNSVPDFTDPDWQFFPFIDSLISFNVGSIIPLTEISSVEAGQDIPANEQPAKTTIGILFEVQEINNGVAVPLNSNGRILNALVIDNTRGTASVKASGRGSGSCERLNVFPGIDCTFYHPYLNETDNRNFLRIRSNDGTFNQEILPNPVPNNPFVRQNMAIPVPAGTKPPACTYTIKVRAYLRLHNGDVRNQFGSANLFAEDSFYFNADL